jgi:hypothetical protein
VADSTGAFSVLVSVPETEVSVDCAKMLKPVNKNSEAVIIFFIPFFYYGTNLFSKLVFFFGNDVNPEKFAVNCKNCLPQALQSIKSGTIARQSKADLTKESALFQRFPLQGSCRMEMWQITKKNKQFFLKDHN